MEFENLIGKEIEQYRVEALVGKGNMAAVFRAQDLNLARPVALKVIYPIYVQNNAWRDHFLQKARAAARLTHPSIVPIYKSGIEDDYVYIVSAFAEGMSLARIIARLEGTNQRIKMDETLQIVAHVADALGVAHQEGLLHLDVKPENIFVQRSQRPLRAGELPLKIQLTDFGLAAVPESPTKTLPHQVGAYHYLPPEHWLGRKIDGRADIYALGALLYYLLCGQYPFPIQSASEAAMRHTLEEPTPIHAVSPGIPPALSADVVRALRKKASERFAHAEQMADALREHAAQLQPSDLFFRAAGAPVVSLVSQWETLRGGTPLPALEPPWQGVALHPVDTPPDPLQSNNDDPIQPEPEYAERNLPATGLSILALPGRGNGTDAFLEPLPELPAVVEPPVVAPAPRRAPAKQPAQAVDENHTPEILLFDDEVDRLHTEQHTLPPQLGDQIIITRQGRGPRRISLNKSLLHIGRARENEVLLSAPDVSRRHAQLEQTSDGWQIADLSSQGGTFLGGVRLEPFVKTSWHHRDTVQIGPYFLHWRPAGASDLFLVNEVTEAQKTELFPVAEDGGQVQSSAGNFRVALSRAMLAMAPGGQEVVQVELFNQGTAVADFQFTLTGLSADSYTIPQKITDVAPGARATLPLKLHLPAISQSPTHHLPAGTHNLDLLVRSTLNATETAKIPLQLVINPVETFAIGIWPKELVSGKECRVMIRNEGNVVSNYGLVGRDPTGQLQFSGQRGRIRLAPGEATNEVLRVRHPERPFLGRRRHFPFTIEVQTATGNALSKSGEMELRPRIPSWTLPLVELLLVAGLIFLVLNNILGGAARAADESSPPAEDSLVTTDPTAPAATDAADIFAPGDQDGDLLNDVDEARLGTNPEELDSDGDGLPDGLEVQLHRTDPLQVDSDGDGLSDGEELNTYQSDPNLPDTDLDGVDDGTEAAQGTDLPRFDLPEDAVEPTLVPAAAAPLSLTVPLAEESGWIATDGAINVGQLPQAGDDAADLVQRGFLIFPLTELSAEAEIVSATLQLAEVELAGEPFTDLDCLQLEVIAEPLPLETTAFNAPALFVTCVESVPQTIDLTAETAAAVAAQEASLRLRLSFATGSDEDGRADVYKLTAAPTLAVTYNAP